MCCTPRVRASYSTTDTFAQLLSVDDSSRRRRVSPVCSSGLDRPRTLHSMYFTVLYCTVLHTVVLHCLLAVSYWLRRVLLPRFFTSWCHLNARALMFANSMIFIGSTNPSLAVLWIPKISSIRDRARFPCCVGCCCAAYRSLCRFARRSIPASRQTGSRENITHFSRDDSSFCFTCLRWELMFSCDPGTVTHCLNSSRSTFLADYYYKK